MEREVLIVRKGSFRPCDIDHLAIPRIDRDTQFRPHPALLAKIDVGRRRFGREVAHASGDARTGETVVAFAISRRCTSCSTAGSWNILGDVPARGGGVMTIDDDVELRAIDYRSVKDGERCPVLPDRKSTCLNSSNIPLSL